MNHVVHHKAQQLRLLKLGFVVLVLMGGQAVVGQHTVVSNNGVGGKIEMDYNAAEKVTEMRTIGADGKLQQKADYEYLPGYYSAQQTDTTYWPNGNVRKMARHTYDENSNFLGEFIQVFDESGKQVGGHKLTHDPWTNIYRCSEWNAALVDYKAVECPSGEEGGGEGHEARKFTYEEVMRHVDAARKKAQDAEVDVRSATGEAGLILPASVFAGERISGMVVNNPEKYDRMQEVTVTRVRLPVTPNGENSQLRNWIIEALGEDPQHADGPITFIVPRDKARFNMVFRQADHPDVLVSVTVEFSKIDAPRPNPPGSFTTTALCLKSELCKVEGPFSGDSRKMFAAWDDRPTTILSETPEAAFVSIPDQIGPGAHALIVGEGSKSVAFPVAVGDFFIKNNGIDLQAGKTLIVSPTLGGPSDIVGPSWSTDLYSATTLAEARRFIPGFQPAKNNERDHESETGEKRDSDENGEILIVITNRAPERSSLRSSKNGMLVFQLTKESFSRGDFKYDLVVEAKTAGKVDVEGHVFRFLAPVTGQEFPLKTGAAR